MSEEGDQPCWLTLGAARNALRSGTGRGVKIAVIDSGVDASHPQLQGLTIADSVGVLEEAGRIVIREGEGSDVFGHGTAVAGLLHEHAPEAVIGSFRTIDSRSLSRTAVICAGIREAMKRGYHILNCSFGCKGLAKFILPHKAWSDEAWLKGVHVVAAANNDDETEVEWPAHFATVHGVGFANSDMNDIYHRPGRLVAYAARGENVKVPWLGGGHRFQTGSSFATPLLAAALARLLSVYPNINPPQAHDLLPQLAEPWTSDLDCSW